MKNSRMKRILSGFLAFVMVLGNVPAVVFASDDTGLCPHHETHGDCGYVEGVTACGYQCADCAAEDEPEPTTEPEVTSEPAATEETKPVCTGLIGCAADIHDESCKGAAVDAVAELIEVLPSLEEIKAKPMEEQGADYNQVQAAYDAYCTLNTEQQTMLPPTEKIFKPYFDYFNSLTKEVSTVASGYAGAVKWTLDSNGKLRIYGTGDMGVYSTDMGVNTAPWREYAGSITTVVIEAGVTSVGSGAFLYCPNITSVTVPTSVKIIGERAFYKCRKLSNMTIPAGVTTIGEYAFAETGLTSVTIPEMINTAVKGMFYDCTNLTTVTFKGAVTNIGECAFYSCDVLKNVNFEKGLSGEIGPSAFAYCPAITEFEIPEGVLKIMESAFSGCSSLASVTLPEGLKSMWVGVFRQTALTSMTIPQSVEYMEVNVFTNCDTLQNVTMYTSTVEGMVGSLGGGSALEYVHIIGNAPQTNKKLFTKHNENFVIYYDEGTSGWVPPTWQDYLIEIWGQEDNTKTGTCGENLTWSLKNGTLTISGTGSMDNYLQGNAPWYIYEHQINQVVIENGVTSIGDYAFWEMEDLTGVSIADTVKSIGQWSFFECAGLTEVTIPNGTVSIGDHAFRWCTGLTTVTIADSVTSLGVGLFTECGKLKRVKLTQNITELPNDLFSNCQRLEEVQIPIGVTVIGSSAFSGCFALKSLEIPDGVTTINSNALSNNGLTDITIPASVTNLGASVFYNCKSLKNIRFQGAAPVFGVNAFQSVTAICTYPANNDTWIADVMKDYGGTITWCVECTGESHIYAQCVVNEQYLKSEATCTVAAEYYKSCVCGEIGEETFFSGEKKEHNMGQWTQVSEATPGVDGEDRRDCNDCDHFETRPVPYQGNALKLEGDLLNQNTVYINGLPYPVKGEGDNRYVELPTEETCYLVTYTWHVGDGQDVHTQYPTGMKVYKVENGKITYIPELDDLLQYSGSSIRITGKKGIRMITSLTKSNKSALTGKGLAGYKLLEYGTVLCFASEVAGDGDLVLGKSYSRSNYAYKRGVADPVFATSGNLTQYTNVLVGFSMDQCKDDIAMRPYIILEDANGQQVTLYGGTIYRSIGYIAYQNRNVFQPKTASYNYVWEIIHHVYGDKYDADYKG